MILVFVEQDVACVLNVPEMSELGKRQWERGVITLVMSTKGLLDVVSGLHSVCNEAW